MWHVVGLVAVMAVTAVLIWVFDPICSRWREYEAELAAREPVTDEQLFLGYFVEGEVAPDVPRRVRRIIAREMKWAADKMLPDDDLSFLGADLDLVEIMMELEAEFGIQLTSAIVAGESADTIRALSRLVSHAANLMQRHS